MPTSGGGAQVVFNDVECLKQMSPTARRKRSGAPSSQTNGVTDSSDRCSAAVDVHTKRPRM